IEGELQALGRAEFPSSAIGEMVMEQLRDLDRVAYVRWARVYKDFQDLESFERVVKDLREEGKEPEDTAQLTMLDDEPLRRRRARARRRSRTNR
ncbi:MAG: transcriptional repressor NrdR, partial [Dehalococcoidia bacterium]